ncbi:uncharacterized protein [Rutidosis leptorrhynchoides]|uniref:uncharacterized protein n=1 Tax=Rutidosis leptorrhynchoides TaxID=125765 RepID=UPI003A99D7ED
MERVLTEGPIIPCKWTEEVSNADGTVVKPVEFVQTPRTQWIEQDDIIYRLDSKIRSIIGNAISVPILRKESLFDLYSRFQVLINDLEGAGVIRTQAELCQKFVDALLENFESIITSMVVSEKLDSYDLSGLFGILTNFEETKLKKKINAKKIANDPDAALVATTKRNKEFFSSYSTKAESDEESDDTSEHEEVQMLEEQMALLTQRIEKKKFEPRKGKSPFDPKKATCFKCGKVGHIAAECWSKVDSSSDSGKYLEKGKKYKQKYKNLKKEGVKPVEKSSSQFEADLKIAEKLNSQSNSDKSTAYKYLLNDFKSCLDENKRLKSELNNLKAIVKEKDLHISETEQCRIELAAYKSSFNKEIIRFDDEKRKISERENKYEKISRQIPADIKAVLGVGFDLKNDTGIEKDPNRFKPNQDSSRARTQTISGSGVTDSNSESGSSDSNIDSVKQNDINERKWFLDIGCSRHMTGCKEHLEGFVEEKGPSVRSGDNSVGKTIGYGSVKAGGVTLKRVALVEGLMHNLLSVSQVTDEECEIRIRKNTGIIYDPKGKPILVAWRQLNVYVVDLDAIDSGIDTCLYSQTIPELN